MTKLSKEYEHTVYYPISYENIPENKLLQEKPINQIGIYVKTTGFKLISAYLFPKKIEVDASLPILKSQTNYFILLNAQRAAIQKQLNAGVTLNHFIKDSISLHLGSLQVKKVPLELDADITFDTGFDIEGGIKMNPDSVIVTGPRAVLDTIQSIKTNRFSANAVNKDISTTLSLSSLEKSNVKLSTQQVTLSANVEKFTEGSMELGFGIIHMPLDIKINTFPKLIKITYQTALSNYNKIDQNSFSIVCDYKMIEEKGFTYLVPKLRKQPEFVKNVKITPNRIDFIIEK